MNKKPYYPFWLDFLPAAVVFLAFIYAISCYGSLPGKIPTHFGFNGRPDAWGTKNVINVFLVPVLGLAISIGMGLMNVFAIRRPKDPGKVLNLTPAQQEALGPVRLEEMRVFMARMLWLTNMVTAMLMAYIGVGCIKTACGSWAGLGWMIWVLVLALIGVSIYMAVIACRYSFMTPDKRK